MSEPGLPEGAKPIFYTREMWCVRVRIEGGFHDFLVDVPSLDQASNLMQDKQVVSAHQVTLSLVRPSVPIEGTEPPL